MTKVKIQTTPQDQYIVTIPKKLAEALGMKKGQEVNWKVAGAGKLELHL